MADYLDLGKEAELAQASAINAYISAGWRIYPAGNKKKPLIRNWQSNAASNDLATIERWLHKYPNAQIGIAAGPSQLVVIDIDSHRGGDATWRDLCGQVGLETFECAPISRTPHGGQHIYLRAPSGIAIPSRTDALGPGIDVKATGGGVIAPPSRVEGFSYS